MSVEIVQNKVNRFAAYSGSRPQQRKSAGNRYGVPSAQALSQTLAAARLPASSGKTIVSITFYGAIFGEFDDDLELMRDRSSEVEIEPSAWGASWKAINASYGRFISEAREAAQRFQTSETRILPAKSRNLLEQRASFQTSEESKSAASPELKHGSESFLRAELAEFADEVAACWIEITEGMRVRATLPSDKLAELSLSEGDEFLWSPATHAIKAITESKSESQERQELRQDLEELSREFREELKTLDTGLDNE